MKVHHIGYAVKEIDEAVKKFRDLGYVVEDKIEDESRKVVIAFARNNDVLVELVAPMGEGSPVDGILDKNGAAPYHICYEVHNIEEACKELKKEGWTVLIKPAPAPAINGALVVFLYNRIVGLIELVEIV